MAIIGVGWIGSETAAAARNAGCEVTVIERAELPLQQVLVGTLPGRPTPETTVADSMRPPAAEYRSVHLASSAA